MIKFVFASFLIVPVAFGQIALTTAQIAKRVSPSVVVIQGKTDSGEVLGSGFIVSKDGKIVTNLHVIRDMKTASVHLANGEVFDSVSVLATDERRDLAVVQIAGFDLPVLGLGNSDVLTIGEPLVVVGSPRGLEGTVTAGILSSVRDSGDGFKVLQTDAAVNPGNSGGPLANGKGQAIGVVSFKLRSAEGLNFAVPINYVRGLLNTLHDPTTLAQMRQALVDTTSTAQQGSGPSLKETLDWLKENIPLSAGHFVVENYLLGLPGSKDVSFKTVATRFDTCTVVLDYTEMTAFEKTPGAPAVETIRFTVPLGAVNKASTFIDDFSALFKVTHFVQWLVVLETASNVILSETHEPWDLNNTTRSESSKTIIISFTEESIARRVVEAFKHAAEICRKKDVF